MKNRNKKIILLVAIAFIFTFSLIIQNVYAADKNNSSTEKKECKSSFTDDMLISLYGIKAKSDDENNATGKIKYTITMNPSEDAKNTKISFTANVVTGELVGSNKKLKNDGSSKVVVLTDAQGNLKVTFSAKASDANEELGLEKGCNGNIKFTIDTSVTVNESSDFYEHQINGDDLDKYINDQGNQTKVLDCSDSSSVGDSVINKLICSARADKDVVIKSNNDFKNYSSYNADKIDFTKENKFKCEVNNFKEASSLKDDKSFFASNEDYLTAIKGDYYYQNRKYLYAWKEVEIKGEDYKFNYDPGKTAASIKSSCKIRCEEGVAVEYGPPIASKAGLCFEYKVRVTSSVRCYMSEKPNKPPTSYKVCTPAPVCTGIGKSGTQYYVRQGGPNEDYDKCIKSCDGGKYTKNCSSKCYKKVYGSTSTKTINNREDFSSIKLVNADVLKKCKDLNGDGCYYTDNGSIYWSANKEGTAGRWYREVSGRDPGSSYGVFGNGFYRHIYGGGDYCHDTCWWQIENCKGKSPDGKYYLNPKVGDSDYKVNEDTYKSLVNSCKAAASCSESTAEFTISVDYTNGNKEVKRITFPYEKVSDIDNQGETLDIDKVSKKDKIASNGNKHSKEDTSKNADSTIIHSPLGCYKDDASENGFYQVAWSFPGSWINYKTGEVSYVDKTGNGGWRSLPNKFCIPLDAQNVNVLWWNSYYGRRLDPAKSSIGQPTAEEKCEHGAAKGSIYTYYETLNESQIKDIVYNINGQTKDFGYFGWNIGVSCFYALNTTIPVIDSSDDTPIPKECKTSSEAARVRTVDLTNLFPSIDGTSKNSDSSKTGRTPGFNWSTYATVNESKNAAYTSSPAQYLADVQKLGYSVYSNNYLDYEITLDKAKLAELKKYSNSVSGESGSTKKDKNYTVFDGTSTVSDKTGVTRYTSNVLNNLGSSIKRPSATARECNNMRNYGSNECQKPGEAS